VIWQNVGSRIPPVGRADRPLVMTLPGWRAELVAE
jgi:hypothetical protein